MPSPLDLVELDYLRTALLELALLAIAGGLVGTWVVLRRLAFFTHAVGTATFPGLVVASAAGVSTAIGGAVAALAYTAGVERAGRRRGVSPDAATALVLVAALAVGDLLSREASDPHEVVEESLFGSLSGLSTSDVLLSGGATLVAVAVSVSCGRAWTAFAFDPDSATRGRRARTLDRLLMAVVALTVVAALSAVGALLVSALFVLPAATALLWARSVSALIAGAIVLALAEALVALYVAHWLAAPPGPVIAVVAGLGFAASAGGRTAIAHGDRTRGPLVAHAPVR